MCRSALKRIAWRKGGVFDVGVESVAVGEGESGRVYSFEWLLALVGYRCDLPAGGAGRWKSKVLP